MFHAIDHAAPDRVLAVEEPRIVQANEELAVSRIGRLRPRHRHRAAHMRLLAEFGAELLPGAAAAGAGRIPGLGHEAVDHAMEHDAVIEALPGELLDARDVLRREV